MKRARKTIVVWSLVAASCAGSDHTPEGTASIDPATLVAVGAGRYTSAPVGGEKPPSNARGLPVEPKVTDSFKGVPTSNDWWSSLIWQFDRDGKRNPHSEPMFAHPLTLQARAEGLGLGGAGKPEITRRTFFYRYREDLVVGVAGLNAAATKVAAYDDWTVTARWEGKGKAALTATFGHGLPFAYFEASGGPALIKLAARPGAEVEVFADLPGTMGVAIGGQAYGLFAPKGATWTRQDANVISDLEGRGVFSVALLPDARLDTLARFRRHAFAFVTGSRVSWRYDAASATLVTRFALTVQQRDLGPSNANTNVPLVALYPHQWKHLGKELPGAGYPSPRGAMKLLGASSFEIELPFAGVMPVLPRPPESRGREGDGFDAAQLASLVNSAARADELFPPGMDGTRGTYWIGKSLERVALLAWLAEQSGEEAAQTTLVDALKRTLEDWFDGQAPNLFSYDKTWATLIGSPSEYRSGWELNDHHFHYGQYVFAAATVARFDPQWAAHSRYGKFVELLIKDCANPDREDRRFPFLRHFDAYAGHSWANGPSLFAEGNNEESSSEDVNFATGVFLWGALTGDQDTRDLGIFLHANLAAAIEQYWFDADGDNFPAGFDKPALGMVWGAGGKYDTWWDRNPTYVHGINFLPFTGGSLHLGRRPDYVASNYAALVKANKGEPRLWREIIWMYLALSDPSKALEQYAQNPHFEPEFGVSRAFVYQWLHALQSYGQVDASVTADVPSYAVLRRGNMRHHVAFNPGAVAMKVRFSDGVTFEVPAHGQKVVSAAAAPATARR